MLPNKHKVRLVAVFVVLILVVAGAAIAEVQQSAKVSRIGLLRAGSPPDPLVEAFRQGLRDLGYVEGKSIVIEPAGLFKHKGTIEEKVPRSQDTLVFLLSN